MAGFNPMASRNRVRFVPPFLCGLSLMLAGCASMGSSNPFIEASDMDQFTLRVESRNTYEVSVFANAGGKRQLLGTVPSNGLEFLQFEYPANRALNLELETRLGDRYRLPPLSVLGGGRLDLVINSELRRSGFINRSPG